MLPYSAEASVVWFAATSTSGEPLVDLEMFTTLWLTCSAITVFVTVSAARLLLDGISEGEFAESVGEGGMLRHAPAYRRSHATVVFLLERSASGTSKMW